MAYTRLVLYSRSTLLAAVYMYMLVFLSDNHQAAAVKVDRAGACWNTYDSSFLDATSDTSAASGQSFYRILNKIDESVYIGGNETLRRVFLANNNVETEEITLATMEPAGLALTCAVQRPTTAETTCWNFIRIVEQTRAGDLLVCGTNALSWLCYQCPQSNIDMCTPLATTLFTQFDVVPEEVNIDAATAIFTTTDAGVDMLYGGSAKEQTFIRYSVQPDLSASDPVEFELDTVTTGQGFIKDATFVGRPFEYTHDDGSEYVFLIYRESALEYTSGPKVYSRIARVCKNDTGAGNKFTTFIKARLECSIPNGDEPVFDYNYVQDVVWDATAKRVHAAFTNQENGPLSSAICQYRMEDIMNLFDNGYFQAQEQGDVNRLWIEDPVTLSPRPGACDREGDTNYQPLLHKAVPSYNAEERTGGTQTTPPDNFPTSDPPIISVDFVGFTSLAVDTTVDSSAVYFVGTSAGSVIKFTTEACEGDNTIRGVELEGFNVNGPINGLALLGSTESATFLLGTSDQQASIRWPLNTRCESLPNAKECGLRYPYCNYTEAECICTASNCTSEMPTETVLTEDVLTVLPDTNVSACLSDHVYWLCNLDSNNVIVSSANVTLQWNGPRTDLEHLISTTSISRELVELDVIVQNSTLGIYTCTADVGGRILTKQAELSMKHDCITHDNLCARKQVYETLKSQSEALHIKYGSGKDCSVQLQNCDSVGLTCPTSP